MTSPTGQKIVSRIDLMRWRIKLYKKAFANFWDSFKQKKSGLLGLAVLIIMVVISAFPSIFAPYDPMEVVGLPFEPPSLAHPLGTDDVGRDMLSQLIYGTRTSIIIGFFAAFISFLIGIALGTLSGFYGGKLDDILMRITEFFLTIPSFPLMLVIAFILKPSIWNVMLAIAIVTWPQPVRVIRSEVFSLRERLYIKRARVIGNSNARILLKYILPKVFPLGLALMIVNVGWAIPSEAFLSWIGLGDPTHISWGMILYYAFGRGSFTVGAWWHFVPPGLMILLVIIAFTNLGRAMEEVLNPKLRKFETL
ncbi:ABC transporter permease [Candidatus Bathyarchaeota archaeon]|nr:MAG: ABC transporter permease [Candidatus Bathyarchaeota archaeon]